MARDLSVEVRQFTVTALAAHAAVSSIAGPRVYGPAEPDKPVWPFVRTDLPLAIPESDGCGGGSRYTFNVHGFAKGEDERAVGLLAKALVEALDELSGDLDADPEAYLRDTEWVSTQMFRDVAEVNGWHAVVRVIARVSG